LKILVTGSQGYLGSVLTAEIVRAGYDCLGCDTGFFRGGLLYPAPTTQTLPVDVRALAEPDLRGVDAVVHLAGISNDPMGKLDVSKVYDPTRAYTFRLAEMCKKHRVKFIFASSCSIYGIGGADLLDETSPVHPQTGYSLNKLQIESDLATLSGNGFDPIALRFATVFGLSPRIRFDVVINMLVGMAFTSGKIILNSDGQAWRPNLHILDLCQSVIAAIQLNNEGRGLEILNVGSEENNMRILDIAKTVQRFVPGSELIFLSQNPELDREGLIKDRKVKDGAEDTRTYKVSFEKIKQVMPSFSCVWSIERGVRHMLDGFRETSLNHKKFKERAFYRLQQLEFLHESGLISDEVSWLPSGLTKS